jgi:hypothetical protein
MVTFLRGVDFTKYRRGQPWEVREAELLRDEVLRVDKALQK